MSNQSNSSDRSELEQLRARVAELETQLEQCHAGQSPTTSFPWAIPVTQTSIPAVIWSLEHGIIEWNSAAEKLFGHKREDVLGTPPLGLIVPVEAQPYVKQILDELFQGEGGVYAKNENITRDGRRIICQWLNTPIMDEAGKLIGIAGFAQDVTAQTRYQEALLSSEERWRSMIHHAPEIILTTDREGTIQFFNRVQPGYSDSDLIGHKIFDFVPREQRAIVERAFERVWTTGDRQNYEVQDAVNKAWYACSVGPIYRSNSGIVGLIILCQEITQRKQGEQALQQTNDELSARVAERTRELDELVRRLQQDIVVREQLEGQLRESEERFRAIVAAIPIPIMISLIADGTILYVNERLCDVVQIPKEELIGQSTITFYQDITERQHIMEQLHSNGGISDYELPMRKPDGTHMWIMVSSQPIVYDGKQALVTSFLDITERHKAEKQLRHERRLLQRLLELQERDRQLIAYEIHDGFVQDVVGGKMLLEAIVARLEQDHDPRLRELNQSLLLLTRAINEGRRMIGELRPMIIDEEGIVAAIMYLINGEKERGAPDIEFIDNIQFDRLDPMVEGAVFRIVQEALGNALRHSHSEDIIVRLTQVDSKLHIEVEDGGVGFDISKVPEDRFGLRGIQERARLFGGHATIESAPGEGTRVHAVLPISIIAEPTS